MIICSCANIYNVRQKLIKKVWVTIPMFDQPQIVLVSTQTIYKMCVDVYKLKDDATKLRVYLLLNS